MGYLSRQPNSNESPGKTWEYGPQPPGDDFAALLNSKAARCANCRRVTMNCYLVERLCPVCRAPRAPA
jgi:hypothetical protein